MKPSSDSDDPLIPDNIDQTSCLICTDDQREDNDNEDEMNNIGTLFEYDKTMGLDTLYEIENEVRLINATAWLQDPISATGLKDEVMEFREAYQNRSFGFEEADRKLQALKIRANAYVLEKDTNKKNALKKWRRLLTVRRRVHKIEQRILDDDSYGKIVKILEHIDEIRNLAAVASKELSDVYSYYFQMDDELLESNDILKKIEAKLNERRGKEGKSRGSKCIWFFCY